MKQLLRLFCLSLLVMVTGMVSAQTYYTVAGDHDIVNGTTDWSPSNAANDMTNVGSDYYKLVVNCELNAGIYEYKVVKNHSWDEGSWPQSNATLNIPANGEYIIMFSFYSNSNDVSAIAIATASVVGSATGSDTGGVSDNLFGTSWDPTSNDMALQSDGTYEWSKNDVELSQGNVKYKIVANHNWDHNWPQNNATLNIPADGTYNCVFTFNPLTEEVNATATPYVAKVGDVKYETLQAAINAVPGGGTTATTVTMLSDYTTTHIIQMGGRNVNLDLDGHTVKLTAGGRLKVTSETLDYDTSGGTTVMGSFFVLGGSTLTVTGNGTITTSNSSYYPTICNVGTLIIEDGTITRTAGRASVIENNYNGQVTINGGTVVNNSTASTVDHTIYNNAGTASSGVMSHPNSKLTINGGSISATANAKNAIDNQAIVEINGGTITGGPVTSGTVPCSAINTHAAAATVTINGGNIFAGNDSEYAKCFNVSTGTVTVNATSTFNRDISSFDGNEHVTINGVVTDNGDGTWTVVAPHYVAQIGETKFVSLDAAVTAAQANDVITLIADDDVSLTTAGSEITINKPLTITGAVDENGKPKFTIFGSTNGALDNNSFNNLFLSCSTGTVTISNVKFDGFGNEISSVMGHSPVFIGSRNQNAVIENVYISNLNCEGIHINGGTFTITDCNIDCSKTTNTIFTKGICVVNDAQGSIESTTITGVECNDPNDTSAAIELQGSGKIAISDCSIQSNTIGIATTPVGELTAGTSQVTISDCTIESPYIAVYSNGDNGALTSIQSGKYSGLLVAGDNDEGFSISGGLFEDMPEQAYCAEGYAPADNPDAATNETYPYTVLELPDVAQIGNVKYKSLQAAVNAVLADTETTIVMIDNETIETNAGVTIPAEKNVVLDLNGKTITGVVQSPDNAQTILNKGTLVITDSSDEKNGMITNVVSDENAGSPGDNKNWFSNAITNTGNLTVNAGNIANTGTGGACYAIDNQTNGNLQTPTLNIAGGNITAKKVAVRMFCNSTTNDNTVNVTGGVITSENAYAIQAQQANNSANKATLNISGGTISGQYAFSDYGNKNVATQFDNATYNITGGFFSGIIWSYATYYCGMDGFVSGGYFDNVVGGDIVAPGSACVDNTEEETMEAYPYTIGLADVYYYWLDNNGQIDGGGYYTIYAPFAGSDVVLMDGEFIELQKDITLTKDIEYIEECDFGDPIFKGGTFTLTFGEYDIDLNGHLFPIPLGVTILTDKQTDIFSAMDSEYKVVESTTETGFAYTVALKEYVAQIGEIKYETLADAVEAVPDDGTETTITMIADEAVTAGVTIDATKNIILELNGKTISGNTDSSKTYALITNKGKLVIQDNTDTATDGTGTGLITTYIANPDGGDIPGYASNTITNNGDLTIKSGKIVNNGSGYACYAIDNQTNGTSYTSTLSIEGGRMQQMNAYTYAVRMFCNSTTNLNSVTVSGGVIEGGYGLWLQTPNTKANMASLTITGGTFNANDGAALYIGGTKADNSNISIDISGSTTYINGTGVIIQGSLSGTYGHTSISDGNIVDVQCGANVEKFITGGIYDNAIKDTYIADGYMCIPYGSDKYTVVPVPASSILVFHDSGTYENAFEVPIYTRTAGATIYYKVNDGEAQQYSRPVSINDDTDLEAWIQIGNTKVGESIFRSFTIQARQTYGINKDGYFYVKNGDNYVNVAGRKSVTLINSTKAEEAAGSVIELVVVNDTVKTLRSQAVDLPGYAKRAMNYVPEMVQLIVNKLHADGSGNILGENGLDAIMTKFDESFDYNLYLEEVEGGYRIYGRTPSMKPVVDFYYENKDQVDAKLPQLEGFINDAVTKLRGKLGNIGNSLPDFSLATVWTNMGGTLTEPVDDETTARFYEEVLSSEANVWSFALETAKLYYDPLMDKIDELSSSGEYESILSQLGNYKKYLEKLPNVQPNFKYYIVADDTKLDFISEGNADIISNNDNAIWSLEERTDFTVTFDCDEKLVDGSGTKYYTTLYTDFAYTLPEQTKAYAVKDVIEVNDKGWAGLAEIQGVIPAQTPVLLMTKVQPEEGQDEVKVTLELTTEAGTAPEVNLLKGNDWVITNQGYDQDDLMTPGMKGLFELLYDKLGQQFYETYLAKYEHLRLLNAGTVNNKYFFEMEKESIEYVDNVRKLGLKDGVLGFWEDYDTGLAANKAFIIDSHDPVYLPLWPDVNRDGKININDVTAMVDIILNNPEAPLETYDHEVADLNGDGKINIHDVTTFVDIQLGIYNSDN